ncbi:MAG: hypothetical protein JW769_04820 [Parachlamydiales bacterium]|nr:hypothetical protein [Parachlamydiales bacterium]
MFFRMLIILCFLLCSTSYAAIRGGKRTDIGSRTSIKEITQKPSVDSKKPSR